jgi:hypothetical protein
MLLIFILSKQKSSEWFTEFDKKVFPLLEHSMLLKNERVKIAILDTGFDAQHLDIIQTRNRDDDEGEGTDRIVKLKTWVANQVADEDSFGHGTHITALILRMTADADIFVAKIAEKHLSPSPSHVAEVSLLGV